MAVIDVDTSYLACTPHDSFKLLMRAEFVDWLQDFYLARREWELFVLKMKYSLLGGDHSKIQFSDEQYRVVYHELFEQIDKKGVSMLCCEVGGWSSGMK